MIAKAACEHLWYFICCVSTLVKHVNISLALYTKCSGSYTGAVGPWEDRWRLFWSLWETYNWKAMIHVFYNGSRNGEITERWSCWYFRGSKMCSAVETIVDITRSKNAIRLFHCMTSRLYKCWLCLVFIMFLKRKKHWPTISICHWFWKVFRL